MPTLSRSVAVALLLLGAPAASAQDVRHGSITISTPWARATPGGATVAGAYLEIKADPGAGDTLLGARSPAAGTVELHDHIHDNGVMRMRQIETMPIAGGASLALKPGGKHLMLMALKAPLKEADVIDITLRFEKAGEVTVKVRVAPVGAQQPAAAQGGAKGQGAGHKH